MEVCFHTLSTSTENWVQEERGQVGLFRGQNQKEARDISQHRQPTCSSGSLPRTLGRGPGDSVGLGKLYGDCPLVFLFSIPGVKSCAISKSLSSLCRNEERVSTLRVVRALGGGCVCVSFCVPLCSLLSGECLWNRERAALSGS